MAASRTFCTAGNSKPIRTARIAITTSNSISVNARLLEYMAEHVPGSDYYENVM